MVWLLSDGAVERQFLRLAKKTDGMVKVISRLKEGDQLIKPENL